MNCVICDQYKWEYLDKHRDFQYWIDRDFIDYKEPKIGFKICTNCGFVTYNVREGLENHYRETYRKYVNGGNLVTSNRKIAYHESFLGDVNRDSILDFGCAHGQALNHLARTWNSKHFRGYELTETFANYGRNVYGLDIISEPEPREEDRGKYDLVMCYHVLEHVPNPFRTLNQLKACLNETGHIYLSVPIWFESCEEPSGNITADFENLFHIDHIQVFSRNHIRNLFRKCGLEIVKENDFTYGHTFLLKAGKSDSRIERDDPAKIIDTIQRQQAAIFHFSRGEFEKAIEIYSDYPDAHCHYAAKTWQKEFQGQHDHLKKALDICTTKEKIVRALGSLYIQWDQCGPGKKGMTNHVKIAEDYFIELLRIKPENEMSLLQLGFIAENYRKDHARAVDYWNRLLTVNPGRFMEIYGFMGMAAGQKWGN